MLSVTPRDLITLLMNVGPVRPIFIWGPPGIGKSALVEQYAQTVGLPCVSLLGSQLAPEDIIGVPEIVAGKSRFCPPTVIARDEPYVLFLDELNACTPEVQKAFYSLIHEQRIGEYRMPEGSVVVGAGNRKQDKALARPIASALINRLVHVELEAHTEQWLAWARQNNIHASILHYIEKRPDHLLADQTSEDTPFSTPRSWHMLSDALHSCDDIIERELIQVLAAGCLSPQHASQFAALAQNWLSPYSVEGVLSGEVAIPFDNPEEATFMIASVRAYLMERLPSDKATIDSETEDLALRAIDLVETISQTDAELVRYFITPENEDHLPAWFVDEMTSLWGDMLEIEEPLPPDNPFGSRPSASPFGGRRRAPTTATP